MSRPNPNSRVRQAKRARLIRDWRALAARTHARIADTRKDAPGSDDSADDGLKRFSMDQEET
jgi:hypothetical protein